MSTRRPVAPDGAGGLSQIVSPDTIDGSIVAAQTDGVYGDGSDGTVTFDGTTTVLGLVPSSNLYQLTRDIYPANLTINAGVGVRANGFRVIVRDVLINNGTLRANGNDYGGNPVNANGTMPGGATAGGAPGATANANGTAGASQSRSIGGSGGAGSNGNGSGTAGAGGTATAPSAGQGLPRSIPAALFANQGGAGALINAFVGGCGGGGGAGGATAGGALGGNGNGGAGGGILCVIARTITGTGTMQANGIAGAVGNNGGTAGNGAGGGGGGGGVIVVSSSIASGAIAGQTIQALAGAGAAGGGANSTGGSAGNVFLIPN